MNIKRILGPILFLFFLVRSLFGQIATQNAHIPYLLPGSLSRIQTLAYRFPKGFFIIQQDSSYLKTHMKHLLRLSSCSIIWQLNH